MKTLLLCLAFACVAVAQDYLNYYPFKNGYADPAYPMPIVANVSTNPPAISLHWAINTFWLTHQFTIQRRKFDLATFQYSEEQFLKNETGGDLVLTSTWGGLFYHTDYTVQVGVCYEYRVIPPGNPNYPDRGTFILTGIDVDYPENRGVMLLVIEDILKDKISSSIQTLKDDLIGDGWKVLTEYVNRNDSVPSVKNKIKSYYDAGLNAKQNLTSVYLFGRIPVPYSGDQSPDGHPDYHNGAWPSDRIYGVFNEQFTDSWVNDTTGYYSRYHNVPGDGKYDQSYYTSQDLWISRVDFADMTTLVSDDATESELLAKYIDKAHRYKINDPSMRFQNYFVTADTFAGGYAYLSYAAAPSAVGWDNVVEGNFMQLGRTPILDNKNVTVESALFAYGSGPGDWTSAANIGQSSDYVTYNPKAAFTFTFGSLFGDWDQKDNFMRAALLSNYSLCNAWVGRPHWVMHHLSLGVPLGLSPMYQQSSYYARWIPSSYCVFCTHVTLLGDPSLRLFSVSPPNNVQAVTSGSVIDISWTIPEDPLPIAGFRVSVLGSDGKWTRSSALLSNTTTSYRFTPPNGFTATYQFSVRTVRVEERSSGRWFNPSIGMMASANIVGTPPPVTTSGHPSSTSGAGSTTGSSTTNFTVDGTINDGDVLKLGFASLILGFLMSH